jgi:aminoglycoside phosphotransferase (APT) family kinase protein
MLRAELDDLIAYLSDLVPPPSGELSECWRGWQIVLVGGGRNGRVFHVTGEGPSGAAGVVGEPSDLAVKLTARDRFDRAGREYHALTALAEAGLAIAPRPVLLERERHASQVVVMTWLEGTVADDPPATDEEWRRMVEHLAAIHRVTPQTTSIAFPDAVLSMRSPADGIATIHREVDRIPRQDQPSSLRAIVERFDAHPFPSWPPPPNALRRGDPNIRNIVQRSGPWASVDWEYSGWSDPAMELGDLIAHAAYLEVPAERWARVTRLYASLVSDDGVARRISVYTSLMYGFWVGRMGRMLYEIPRGLDDRLAPWPSGWLDHVQCTYERYLALANQALS